MTVRAVREQLEPFGGARHVFVCGPTAFVEHVRITPDGNESPFDRVSGHERDQGYTTAP